MYIFTHAWYIEVLCQQLFKGGLQLCSYCHIRTSHNTYTANYMYMNTIHMYCTCL